jgi:17beta-estradiol 17-dehydrogenase / very-long-chain 3-oxoacyl-CoA reductase
MEYVDLAKGFMQEQVDYVHGFLPTKLAASVVVALIVNVITTVVSFIFDHFIRGEASVKRFGKWAVVTGATDGIGLAFAEQFAKRGLNVVMISRSKDKLDDKAREISDKCPNVEIKTLAIDFSTIRDANVQKKIGKFLEGLEIGILVNNVGISYQYPKYFHELDDERVTALMTLNAEATTWMTRIVLDQGGMVARKRGAVINMASIAGVATSPLLAQYGAVKGLIAQQTRALHYEYASKGIYFQCQVPLFVTTRMSRLRKASLTIASESQYAKAGIKALANMTGVVVSPYWSHAIQYSILQMLPEPVAAYFIGTLTHIPIRKAGMRKDAKAAEEASKSR